MSALRAAIHGVLVVFALALGGAGCGYQFAGRQVATLPIALEVDSVALEPGLALVARRAIESAASRQGLSLVHGASAAERAVYAVRITVEEVAAEPIGNVHREGGGGGVVAATTWQAHAVLEAEILGATDGGAPVRHRAHATALYEDAGLPLWTDAARERATEQAIGLACEELGDWLAVTIATAD